MSVTDCVRQVVCSELARKPVLLALLSVLLAALVCEGVSGRDLSAPHTAIRRLDCSVFCRKTGFNGYVGGCQCGFTLFANKRSPLAPSFQRARLFQVPSPKLLYPDNNFAPADDDLVEEVELRPGNKDRPLGLGNNN